MAQIGNIVITNPYALATPPNVTDGAAYMTFTLEGGQEDVLTQVAPGSGAPFNMAMPMTFAIDGNGLWGMAGVKGMRVSPGIPTLLTPGYAHLMIMGLTQPLQPGQMFDLQLTFQNAGTGNVAVTVVDAAPSP